MKPMTGRNKDSLSSHRHAIPRLVLAMRRKQTSGWLGLLFMKPMTGRNKDLTDNRPEREVINRKKEQRQDES